MITISDKLQEMTLAELAVSDDLQIQSAVSLSKIATHKQTGEQVTLVCFNEEAELIAEAYCALEYKSEITYSYSLVAAMNHWNFLLCDIDENRDNFEISSTNRMGNPN